MDGTASTSRGRYFDHRIENVVAHVGGFVELLLLHRLIDDCHRRMESQFPAVDGIRLHDISSACFLQRHPRAYLLEV